VVFLSAGWLWALAVLVVLGLVYLGVHLLRPRYVERFTSRAQLDLLAPRRPGWRRHLPAVLFAAVMTLIIIAAARPADTVKVPRDRATIMVAMDVSLSMTATDMTPSRLAAAQRTATRLIVDLPQRFNVGLMSYAQSTAVLVSPTVDHQAVITAIANLRPPHADTAGTTGRGVSAAEAVFTALDAIGSFDQRASSDPPPSAIVVLSDGDNNRGRPAAEAIAAALKAKVPVSAITYGTPQGALDIAGQTIPVPSNSETLQGLSNGTGGRTYTAQDTAPLDEIYRQIGSSITMTTVHQEIGQRFILWAIFIGLALAATSSLLHTRFP
jgi:Ca-activated chloride channel family protein